MDTPTSDLQADWLTVETTSPAETEAFGFRLAQALPVGAVVLLYGDLGAGKTVLARGMARGMGIQEPVTSPTFALVQEYRSTPGRWFYHLDLYRIDGEAAAIAFGIDEYLFRPDSVTAVEWPERIAGLLPRRAPNLVRLLLEAPDEFRRRIHVPKQWCPV